MLQKVGDIFVKTLIKIEEKTKYASKIDLEWFVGTSLGLSEKGVKTSKDNNAESKKEFTNISAKLLPKSKLFHGENQIPTYLFIQKSRIQKSHATVPLRVNGNIVVVLDSGVK